MSIKFDGTVLQISGDPTTNEQVVMINLRLVNFIAFSHLTYVANPALQYDFSVEFATNTTKRLKVSKEDYEQLKRELPQRMNRE